ncbi:MAG: serine hydroxymethyltransferase [Planctomycetota bacterium]
MKYKHNFLLDTKLSVLDPDMDFFIRSEENRQSKNLLMIASESLCPRPVRETLTSLFTNKYAEGYPSLRMTINERTRIEKEPERYLAFHRRYGDRRFYKGAEYCNFIEVLAQRRAAEIFANPNAPVDNIFVNVQPLSGAAANNAVYNAFLTIGDTIMGMSLSYGGHLTHGSPFNRSGRQYKVIPYTVDPKTGKFDYDLLEKLAIEHKPKIIIAGASAYPWTIDWSKLKAICQKVPIQIPGINQSGALLMADISHPAGLVVAGLFPNPVGIADVITFTTHKTLCGPRGAVIISTEEDIAKRIDLGVFPGEQGGPHLNNIAAKAVCFKIAATQKFKELQQKIVENCRILADEFKKLGLTLAYGGTNTHLVLVDLDSIKTTSGIPLKGDVASNILDICGITCNKNSLPGDETGTRTRGVRFGTTILSQLGMGKDEMVKIAHLVYDIISNIRTFAVISHSGKIVRGKIDIRIMEKVRNEVNKLLGTKIESKKPKENIIEVRGERATAFLQSLVNDNLYQLKAGQSIKTILKYNVGKSTGINVILKFHELDKSEQVYWLMPAQKEIDKILRYFKGLSDGYIAFDNDDVYLKVEGPVVIKLLKAVIKASSITRLESPLPFQPKSEFVYKPYTGEPRRTSLYGEHLKLTKPQFIVPFAGWSMPLWYTRASEEHQAVRSAAGLFDVSHMGKLEISGYYATRFIDLVTTNYVPRLKIGQSHYSYIFNPDGNIMDDILLYRLSEDKYLMVVNASNKEKIHQWLDAVNSHQFIIDRDNSKREMENSVVIKDWAEEDPIVNVALQGPAGLKILLSLTANKESAKKLRRLKKTFFTSLELGGSSKTLMHLHPVRSDESVGNRAGQSSGAKTLDASNGAGINALIARTGYTGEDIAYEIFVPKADAVRFWNLLLETGKDLGLKPCGLAARDSLRTEAGLPLYGHELAGDNSITPFEASYGSFVKRHKPFFIGRKAYIEKDKQIHRRIVRFKVTTPNARAIKTGDSVLLNDNNKIGVVTSCTLAQNAQIGLALVEKKYAKGTTLQIIPTPRPGSQIPPQPVQAVIMTRFMR